MNCPNCLKQFSIKENMRFYSWWGGRTVKQCPKCNQSLILQLRPVLLVNIGSLVILAGLCIRMLFGDHFTDPVRLNMLTFVLGSILIGTGITLQKLTTADHPDDAPEEQSNGKGNGKSKSDGTPIKK